MHRNRIKRQFQLENLALVLLNQDFLLPISGLKVWTDAFSIFSRSNVWSWWTHDTSKLCQWSFTCTWHIQHSTKFSTFYPFFLRWYFTLHFLFYWYDALDWFLYNKPHLQFLDEVHLIMYISIYICCKYDSLIFCWNRYS
jgi:hypothetical protein